MSSQPRLWGSVTSLLSLESGSSARVAPALCTGHQLPAVCADRRCEALHVCRLFADGFCPLLDTSCPWGHCIGGERNRPALERHLLVALPEHHLLWLARALVRQTCPVSDMEYHRLLVVCEEYASEAGCSTSACFRLHLCPRMARGRCPVGDECPLNHQLASYENLMVLLRLRCADMPEQEVLNLLRRNMAGDLEDAMRSSNGEEGEEETTSDEEVSIVTASSLASGVSDLTETKPCNGDTGLATRAEPSDMSNGSDITDPPSSAVGPSPAPSAAASVDSASGEDTKQQRLKELTVCCLYCYPSKCNAGDSCNKLHLCRYFVADMCPYTVGCVRDHRVSKSQHNQRVLATLGVSAFSDQQVLQALRTGWLREHPVTPTERRFLLHLCRAYMNNAACDGNCSRLHVCQSYMYGTCTGHCQQSHQLNSLKNAAVLRGLGLGPMLPPEIKDVVISKIPTKNVWDSWAPGQNKALIPAGGAVSTPPPNQPRPNPAPRKRAINYTEAIKDPTPAREATPVMPSTPQVLGSAANGDLAAALPACSVDELAAEIETELSLAPDEPPGLCATHAAGEKCQDPGCGDFHVCGFFLANLCRRADDNCAAGHSFQADHNVLVMTRHGLVGGSPEHFQTLLDQITLAARFTFKNDAQLRVKMCIPYNSAGGCTVEQCQSFHLCNRFLAGSCDKGGAEGCGLVHKVTGKHNQSVWRALGLRRTLKGGPVGDWATDTDIIELLRAKLGVRAGSPTLAASQPSAAALVTAPAAATKSAVAVSSHPAAAAAPPAKASDIRAPSAAAVASSQSAVPALCVQFGLGSPCDGITCGSLHLCPHWLQGECRRGSTGAVPCALGHSLNSAHNQRVLAASGIAVPTDATAQETLLKEVQRASHVRDVTVYQKLRMCIPYSSKEGCTNGQCGKIHVCQKFVAGSCTEKCPLGLCHNVIWRNNLTRLRDLGLCDTTEQEVLELLRARHGCKSRSPWV